jgi:antitoxin (DNA-binding transcriptional repressor) of toxin-antitoxin stability system
MLGEETISATEFKAKCLELLDRLSQHKVSKIRVTKRGRVVAVLTPPDQPTNSEGLFGLMRGSVIIPEGADLTAPVLDEPLDAAEGRLHR